MTAAETTQPAAFTVVAPADMIQLAAPIVAIHLEMTQEEAAAQLRYGQVHMANSRAALRLLPLLQVLGFSPQILTGPSDMIAVQVGDITDAIRLAPELARLLQREVSAVLTALQRPGGIVLADLTATQTADLRRALRPLGGVRVTQASGLYDLFAIAPLDPGNCHALRRHLAATGRAPCRFSGALAAGLTARQVAQLNARIDDAGLLAVNRAFQRFDLFLTGISDLPAQDVAAFLVTRADLSSTMIEGVTPLCPLQIESGLLRASAIQFQADYAAIGLETCARLARH